MPLQKDLQQDCAEQMLMNASKQVLGKPYAFNYGKKEVLDEQVDFAPAVMFGDDSERRLWTSGANEQSLLADLNALSKTQSYFIRTGAMGTAGHYQMLSFADGRGWHLYSSEKNQAFLTDLAGNLTDAGREKLLTQSNVTWGTKHGEYCILVIEATSLSLNLAAQYVYDMRLDSDKALENLYNNAKKANFVCQIDATKQSQFAPLPASLDEEEVDSANDLTNARRSPEQEFYDNGDYDRVPLYLKTGREELQDNDITALMPKSSGNVEVLAVVDNSSEESAELIYDQVWDSLGNPDIKHIMFPVGPGHWQGIYITKPDTEDAPYEVEVFDSMGTESAKRLKATVAHIFQGLNYHVSFKAPSLSQQDGFSCGDFVCGYSHKKMQAFGAAAGSFQQPLINAFDAAKGNSDNSLRTAMRQRSAVIDGVDPASIPLSQQLFKVNQSSYGKGICHLKALLNARESLFQSVSAAEVKSDELTSPVEQQIESDRQLATKLQCEEFINAGYKP